MGEHRMNAGIMIIVNGSKATYNSPHQNFTGKEVSKYGTQFWFEDGFLHRADGPAVIYVNGRVAEWYINGVPIHSYEQYQELTACSNNDILWWKITYGEMPAKP